MSNQIGGVPSFYEADNSLSAVVPSVQAVSDVASTVDYSYPYHRLHIINDGEATVYYAFDGTAEASDSFSQLQGGEFKKYNGEFTTVSFICSAGLSSSVRLEAR